MMLENIVSRTETEICYIKRSSYTKDITSEFNWTFDLDVQSGIEVPICMVISFVQRDHFDQQNIDTI